MKCQNIVLYLLQLIPQATNVDRYVAHLRDLLQLADPTTISSIGMPMHNTMSGLLITTEFQITCFYNSGKQRDLMRKDGSRFVHWEGLSHVLIKDSNSSKEWTIQKPRIAKGSSELYVLPIDMDFDIASFHDPMNMIDIDLIRNDIIDRTNKQFSEIQLINCPNEIHISAWATYGGTSILVIIVLCIIGYRLCPCCYCFRCCHEDRR